MVEAREGLQGENFWFGTLYAVYVGVDRIAL